MDHLNRDQAPFGDGLWKALDEAAVEAARDILTARRFVEVEGPYGPGLTSIEVGDDTPADENEDGVAISVAGSLAVPLLRKTFRLGIRRIAAAREGRPLDLAPVEDAAEALAAAEEALIYQGAAGLQGLLTAPQRAKVKGSDWNEPEQALQDVLAAIGKLNDAGFRGPYALALSPARYNSLYRLYGGTEMLQLKHFGNICALGVYKAPIDGGVVVDTRAATLVVGSDLGVGYAGTDGSHHVLFLSESLVLRLDDPEGICTLG